MNKRIFLNILLILNFTIPGNQVFAFNFPWSNKTISLGLPLKCTLNKDCFILYYPDRIAEEGFRDYECGKLSFENNKSVVFDFIPEQGALSNIEVIAAADGVVSEIVLNKPTKGINSMVNTGIPYVNISHGNGFKTKYSFLNKNKILVKKGQRVKQADVIAFTDYKNSDLNEVYFTVLKNGRAIDPFLGPDASYGCNTIGKQLWQEAIPYNPISIVNSDFLSNDAFQRNIFFDLRTWGLMEGDVETFDLYDPYRLLVSSAINEIDEDGNFYKSKVTFEEAPTELLEEGLWTIGYKVNRKGKVIFSHNDTFVLTREKSGSWNKL
jgi:murein DD-endopeptidase